MRRRFLLVIGFASLAGLLAAIVVYQGVMQKVTREAGKQATEHIVVATVNMELGEPVTSQHVKLAGWPKYSVPRDAFRSLPEVEGQVARTSIVAGEPLLKSKLLELKDAARVGLLPMIVPEGLRAVTIKVDKAAEESGLLQANSRVDVLVSLTKEGGEQVAKVILQNVPILAAGQDFETQENNKKIKVGTVTLALTPEQAERLALGQTSGKLTLATRNFRDNQSVNTAGATKGTLLGVAPSVPQANANGDRAAERVSPPKVKTHMVSVIRAGKVSEYAFARHAGEFWVAVTPR